MRLQSTQPGGSVVSGGQRHMGLHHQVRWSAERVRRHVYRPATTSAATTAAGQKVFQLVPRSTRHADRTTDSIESATDPTEVPSPRLRRIWAPLPTVVMARASSQYSVKKIGQSRTPDQRRHAIITLSLIHISEPTRRTPISYAVFCL